ncbi:conserved hypothetical protein [Luteimonas sp. 9C]|uniref:DNA cytosine methyltransferase n=1 Tax=Luteimonas sp. 9C TaxID=2653148 RepID=UPI0012F20949|nr:DNA cytosine methyltransferase [Luteimonas sp. 9C]VXB25384.1 conserved hypothetical protein [Luteimonas sp. 9C]
MSVARKHNHRTIGVIDIFAGPGGLGEGFSSFEAVEGSGLHPFELAVSAEMEVSAHTTLRLRAFYRLLLKHEDEVPNEYWDYLRLVASDSAVTPQEHFKSGRLAALWREANAEALNLTLGRPADNEALFQRINDVRDGYDEMILIGGPPCQAYSLVGRARQRKVEGFSTKGDPRHFLYQQYLAILARFKPAVFIMENVKGILSSRVGSQEMFSAIQRDLANPSAALGHPTLGAGKSARYVLLPIHVPEGTERTGDLVAADPAAFIIRGESHGLPQARHRVIIMGIREDCLRPEVASAKGLDEDDSIKVEHALAGLPKLRSGLSRRPDDSFEWFDAVQRERKKVIAATRGPLGPVAKVLSEILPAYDLPRESTKYLPGRTGALALELRGEGPGIVFNHRARGHMESDLGRYLFCAAYAQAYGVSPKSVDFPNVLAPNHENWMSGDFADRFRVQKRGSPSSTVTSHLSKDGHAFIHWDPTQCRSLTVREAARLQTFPDNYLFLGNRTQQFVQVGNAVPPRLARQIAKVVWAMLY